MSDFESAPSAAPAAPSSSPSPSPASTPFQRDVQRTDAGRSEVARTRSDAAATRATARGEGPQAPGAQPDAADPGSAIDAGTLRSGERFRITGQDGKTYTLDANDVQRLTEWAVERAENVLLPALDEWRTGTKSPTTDASPIAAPGTLDWIFAEYRADRRFTKLDARTKRNDEVGFRMVGAYVLKNGKRLGTIPLTRIDTSVVDELYGKLLVVKEVDVGGNVIERERRTTVNHAMKSCRRAWNIAARRNPGKLPHINPFSAMGLESSERETPTATFAELQAFRTKAIEMGLSSLATAALIRFEWLQREIDIFATFEVGHYRPREHPNAVRVVHEKTGEENWIPLFDDDGRPFFPVLMGELDAIKRTRIAGLMLRRDWGKHDPWPTYPHGPSRSHPHEP